MSNPVAGQDFLINMVTTEDLTNYQAITIEYKKPDGTIVVGSCAYFNRNRDRNNQLFIARYNHG